MKSIKINFVDFWSGFNKLDNYFYNLLSEKFNVIIDNNPDYLFYSIFGNENLKYNCIKISYYGENISPDSRYCDYSFSFDPTNDKNYRLPHYLLYDNYYNMVNKSYDESLLNRKFCNFLVSNGACAERNELFRKLSKYKKIESGGLYENNIGYCVGDKLEWQKNFKFTISYENNAYRPGYEWYITEKLPHAMQSNTIGIYKGGSNVNKDFNEKSFINAHNFNNVDDLISYIIDIDSDDNKYMDIIKEPWFIENKIPENNKIENIKNFLYRIFEKK